MRRIMTLLTATLLTGILHAQIYNVRDYGAVSDTTVLSTTAMQQAIDACHRAGGGTVWVPAGNYLCTELILKDNITLHLDNGATIYASRKVADYTHSKGYAVGATDIDRAYALIRANQARNIGITGKGTLHCRAERVSYQRTPYPVAKDSVTGREVANAHKYGADYRTKYKKVPPYTGAISMDNCTNVTLRDIQVIEANGWSVHLRGCERVVADGLYIESSGKNGVNSDGLDIDGCSRVMIQNCVIDTGDDALCLKTTRNAEGKAFPCRWITVSNCVLTSSSAALKLGTESHADFSDITVSNCVIRSANRGLNMIIRDGGKVRNVMFSNLVIDCVRKATFWWGNGDPLYFTIQKRKGAESAGSIENVTLNHIIAHGQSGVRMEGFSEHLKNIRMEDFQLFMHPEDAIDKRARNAFLFDGVDGLKLEDCSVIWDKTNVPDEWESAFLFHDVNGLEAEKLDAPQAPNKRFEAIRYENVTFSTPSCHPERSEGSVNIKNKK
ncbi:MAG: right-handed parallel beta-helix repeat-containing protein [Bacteroides sp.]|nr:right-handed parallel beta-helix repeat-containing protein [Bacteroides sp.]